MAHRASPAPQVPLTLPLGAYWELAEGSVDSTAFLGALPSTFPEATQAYFEGSAIAQDVVQIFERCAEAGPYLPKAQTIWSTGTIRRFRCTFSAALCEALAAASENHAEVELFDNIFLYSHRQVLLEWPDAFANCMWIAPSIDEQRVQSFANVCGLAYKHASAG